jgi:hypothetical protein
VTINVLANDSDPAGSKLTITSIVTAPANGTATIVNGKITYTPSTRSLGRSFQSSIRFSGTMSPRLRGKGITLVQRLAVCG